MNQPQPGKYEHIALAAIRPSTTNPRKHFDPAALEELTASVREMGVTEPITVRPVAIYRAEQVDNIAWRVVQVNPRRVIDTLEEGTPEENRLGAAVQAEHLNHPVGSTITYNLETEVLHDQYELVTGERRYRASIAAGRQDIPAIIKEMTDDEARDQQLVENLQRADLHPIEEAEGYRALMAGGTASVEDVARKAGKTMGYVAQRMKLMNLELPAKTLFHAGHLTLGHALHLARLTPADQDRATRELAGLNHLPKKADLVAEVTKMADGHRERGSAHRLIRQTEGELKTWIAGHVLLSLDKVPWSLEDPLLVPEAGPCTTCPKRTGANAALFADLTAEDDVCTDPACFATKQKAVQTVAIQAAAEQGAPLLRLSAKDSHQPLPENLPAKTVIRSGQWVKAKARSCESVRKGILTDQPSHWDNELKGAKAGDVLTVCADQKCKVHKHTVNKKLPSGGGYNYAAEEAKKKAYVESETPIRAAIIDAVKRSGSDTGGMYEIRSAVFAHILEYAAVCRAQQWEFKDMESRWQANQNAEDVVKNKIESADNYLLGRMVLVDALERHAEPHAYFGRDSDRLALWAIAEHYGVDADAIAAAIEAEAETRKPRPEAKPAKAGTKKVSAEAQAERKKAPAKKFPSKGKKKAKVLTAAQRKKLMKSVNDAIASRQTYVPKPLDGKQKAAGERAETGVA